MPDRLIPQNLSLGDGAVRGSSGGRSWVNSGEDREDALGGPFRAPRVFLIQGSATQGWFMRERSRDREAWARGWRAEAYAFRMSAGPREI